MFRGTSLVRHKHLVSLPFVLIVLSQVTPLEAQTVPMSEVAGGYAFMRDDDIDENFPAGWFVSGAVNLNDWLAIDGEISGSYTTLETPIGDARLSVHTFMGGPRFFRRLSGLTPFVQVLFGAARATAEASVLGVAMSESATEFAVQPGGGIDVHLTDRISARLEGDWRRIVTGDEAGNEVRVAAGMVYGF